MSSSLAGLKALVIGGSNGIGLAIAHRFLDCGATVAIAGRTPDRVAAAARDLSTPGAEAPGFTVDIADDADRERFFAEVDRRFGTPDILVNSQGITTLQPAENFDTAAYDHLVNINQRSVFFCCTHFGRGMLDRGSGAIINIASLAAHRGFQLSAPYTMTKHAVLGLTRVLAAEWAPRGVRVNSISPGFFMTDLNQAKMDPQRKATAQARTPIGRFGKLEELCSAAEFLASPQSGYVTGIDVAVDGAYLAAGL
jgi:NAD(P)-dependent dehydrogenase (short-subunit alcohol dehydrogenase family)